MPCGMAHEVTGRDRGVPVEAESRNWHPRQRGVAVRGDRWRSILGEDGEDGEGVRLGKERVLVIPGALSETARELAYG